MTAETVTRMRCDVCGEYVREEGSHFTIWYGQMEMDVCDQCQRDRPISDLIAAIQRRIDG